MTLSRNEGQLRITENSREMTCSLLGMQLKPFEIKIWASPET